MLMLILNLGGTGYQPVQAGNRTREFAPTLLTISVAAWPRCAFAPLR